MFLDPTACTRPSTFRSSPPRATVKSLSRGKAGDRPLWHTKSSPKMCGVWKRSQQGDEVLGGLGFGNAPSDMSDSLRRLIVESCISEDAPFPQRMVFAKIESRYAGKRKGEKDDRRRN
ncbi:hypothetical protein PM082_012285 [Marasmius tenuissimus]|nr:hypothetical protein PM082_012285 [Marasmius tenuissimus]